MKCSEYEVMIAGYIDNELDRERTLLLEKHLKECRSCCIELERAKMMKSTLDMMAIRTPEDDYWDGYWAGIYNRLERQVAWIFCAMGVLILVSGGLMVMFRDVLFAEDVSLWVSIGGTVSIFGSAALLISVIRERTRVNRHERYKDVRR
ncbi:zf-HC2 domain-containing protein [bacterium]|nr:zf-HC2 domain-containing protein [bacterium]